MPKFVLSLGVFMKLFCFRRIITNKDLAENFLGIRVTENNSELSNTINGRRGININWNLLPENEVTQIINRDTTYRTVLHDKERQIDFLYRIIYGETPDLLPLAHKFFRLFQHVMLPTNRDCCYQGWNDRILSAINDCEADLLFSAYSEYIGDRMNEESQEVNQEEILVVYRKIASEWLETQKNTGRYRGYFYTRGHCEITEVKNKLLTKDGRKINLFDMLFHYDDSNMHSVNLRGKGGAGKSFQILRCIEQILKEDKMTVPIYIPLSSLGYGAVLSSNCISDYLQNQIGFEHTDEALSALGTSAIVFADGLNEISDPDIRRKIARDICELRQHYRTRFLISSRQDHTALFNGLNYGEDKHFVCCEVLDLDNAQIDHYLERVRCPKRYHDIPIVIQPLLQTPQGLVMYAELAGSNLNAMDEIDSLGKLLEFYCNSLLGIDNRTAALQFESILQKIAYAMVLDETFVISTEKLITLIGEGSTLELMEEASPTRSIFTLNDKSRNEEFAFTHQNYRDYYCARCFANQINSICADNISEKLGQIFKVNNVTTNNEILELASAFLSDGIQSVQRVIDVLRESQGALEEISGTHYDFPLKVLIQIYAYAHGNCIAGLNLSNLNLTEVCLNGYELFSLDEKKRIELSGARINLNTFLKSGLPTASSTVCRYELNGKAYVAAFSSTTAMIIDIEENQIRMVRNLPDYGWVNCALVTEYKGNTCIFLGCEKDCIAVFDPTKLETNPKYKWIETGYKSNGGIETILRVVWNGDDNIVFCNTDGIVFIRKLYCENDADLLVLPVWDNSDKLEEVVALYDSKDMQLACHCALDESENILLIAFGRKLYYVDGENLSEGVREYKVAWGGLFPELIKDIRVTNNYIFLNEGDIISIFSKKRPKMPKIWEFIISPDNVEERRRKQLKKRLTVEKIDGVIESEKAHSQTYAGDIHDFFFTKFSSVPCEYYPGEEAVLVGVKTHNANLYKKIPEFFEIRIKSSDVEATEVTVVSVLGEQRLATFTGAYYKLQSTPSVIHVATTSDDRSVDLITPHNEEIAPLHFHGAYNGVRDLKIVDDNNIVCALYDGSVLHLHKEPSGSLIDAYDELDDLDLFESSDTSNCTVQDETETYSEGNWLVATVIKAHDGWVWKVAPYEYTEAGLQSVISCSFDRTVKLTNLTSGSIESPIIHGSQIILDFYITDDKNDIWATSQNYIYHAKRSDGSWEETKPYHAEGKQIRLLMNLGDDHPYVFYNTGNGTQGFIAQLEEDHDLRSIITCEESVFIRKMRTARIGDQDYLLIAGTRNKEAYLAAYLKKNRDEYSLISSCNITEGTEANDFTLVDTEYGLVAVIVCKNNTVLLCFIDSKAQITPIHESVEVTGQPMCVDARGELVLTGLLNGEIKRIRLSESGCSISDFGVTHADLLANHSINLSNCIIEDKAKFEEQLKVYFTL